jgi:hypothetical protein
MKNSFDEQDDYQQDILGMDAFLFSDPRDWADDGYGRPGLDEYGGYEDYDPEYYENEEYEEDYDDEDYE